MFRVFKYFKDIKLKRGQIYVANTGANIALDKVFWQDAKSVLKIYAYFLVRQFKQILSKTDPEKRIAFYPETPGPWYNIWQVSRLAGLKTTSNLTQADCIFMFEDSTFSKMDDPEIRSPSVLKINDRIKDISKKRVADIFELVFDYNLRIDPTKYNGQAIRKSNANGTHDGVVIDCPIDENLVLAGQAYQRLVDSTFDGETSEDLRIAYTMGEIALVYHKHKPLSDRFGTYYLSVDILKAPDVFSELEIKLIIEFCQKMGLDFGAVDVMRDKHDGRIYIVDVNKTCMPVLCLSLKDQIKAQKKIADALLRGLKARET